MNEKTIPKITDFNEQMTTHHKNVCGYIYRHELTDKEKVLKFTRSLIAIRYSLELEVEKIKIE